MAARGSIIKAVITADARTFVTEMDRASRKMDDWGRKLTRNVTLPLVGAGVGAFKMASDLSEASSQAAQVFGAEAGKIADAAKNLEDSFSETEYLAMASNVGDIAQGMGIMQSEADDLAMSVLSLGQDLGSFKNLPTERAVNAITSALTGEREALKSLGIVVNEQMVLEKALAMGLADTTGEIDQQAKALATMQLITEASSNAVGDFDRTADGAANQTRILTANFKDAAANLGTDLLPLGMQLLEWASSLVNVFTSLDPTTQKIVLGIAGIAAAAGPTLRAGSKLIDTFSRLGLKGSALTIGIGAVSVGLGVLWNKIRAGQADWAGLEASLARIDGLASQFTSTLNELSGALTPSTYEMAAAEFAVLGLAEQLNEAGLTGQAFKDAIDEWLVPLGVGEFEATGAMVDFAAKLADGTESGDALAASMMDVRRGLLEAQGDIIGTTIIMGDLERSVDGVTAAMYRIPSNIRGTYIPSLGTHIPAFADGGIVTSPTLALIGEAGPEAVVPLSGASGSMPNLGGPTTVVVELDGEVLLEAIARADRRSGGTILGVT